MPVMPSVASAMLRAVEKRGPDWRQTVTWDRAFARNGNEVANAMSVARLAIRDASPLANQPMSNERGDIWIAYNGEVYDWDAHARRLSEHGPEFRTRCDTEFVLRAYETWGIDFVSRLRGMFAIAVLDLRAKQLFLIRDRMGEKPLVYARCGESLAFGSTVRAVLPFLPAKDRRFSADAIDAFLAHRYVPAPRTILEDVFRLEPGHWFRIDLVTREVERRRYWTPGTSQASPGAALEEAIGMRTVADRPVGLFLSGGVDSSLLAQRIAECGRHDISAFTASFPGSSFDEAPLARETAGRLGLPHVVVDMPTDVESDFSAIVADLDEPFADPSAFPMWYLCRHASGAVKAALVGDGLDELLGGYKRVHKHLKGAWRRGWHLPRLRLPPAMDSKGWTKWVAEATLSWEEAYSLRFSGFTPAQRRFLQPAIICPRSTYWSMPETAERDPMETLLEIDMRNYLPEYILRKSDLCSMSHGLELRPPFLDHIWIEALRGMPAAEKFMSPPKSVMGRLCPAIAPLDLFSRPKRGFNPPVQDWFRGSIAGRLPGLGERLRDLTGGRLDAGAVDAMCSSHRRNAEQLLQLLILDESLRQLRHVA